MRALTASPALRRAARAALGFVLVCGLTAAAPAQTGRVVDEILTLVNGEIITRTDLLWSLALDAEAPSPAGPVNGDILRRKLDVMVDQRLILQEAAKVPAEITAQEVNRKRTELIKEFPSEAAFRARVESVGLTPERIDELIRQRIAIERFVDFRFRSFVLVTDQEIQRYYDEEFAPKAKEGGTVPAPLDARLPDGMTVRDYITAILRERKIDQEIDRFLTAARQRAEIVTLAEP